MSISLQTYHILDLTKTLTNVKQVRQRGNLVDPIMLLFIHIILVFHHSITNLKLKSFTPFLINFYKQKHIQRKYEQSSCNHCSVLGRSCLHGHLYLVYLPQTHALLVRYNKTYVLIKFPLFLAVPNNVVEAKKEIIITFKCKHKSDCLDNLACQACVDCRCKKGICRCHGFEEETGNPTAAPLP